MSQTKRKTALVTGASGGIGYELSVRLAQGGYDLILVARSEDALARHAEALSERYGISARPLAQDLAVPGAAEAVAEAVPEPVEVLVNNAGFGDFGPFAESEAERQLRMIQLNVTALTALTRRFLDGMTRRRRGRILNVASTAAFFPGPLMAVYYATKAYVLHFSEALAEELRGSGVTVTALCPGPTETSFQERAQMERSKLVQSGLMDAAAVAEAGYKGLMAGAPLVIPGWQNKVLVQSARLLPRRVVPPLIRRVQEERKA